MPVKSDDRNINDFMTVLEDTIQTHSVKSAFDNATVYPKCLILDEIDGASPAAIKMLADLISDEEKQLSMSHAETPEHLPKTGLKTKKKCILINRPIICLANEIYLSSLKPLRDLAFVIHIDNISEHRLLTRLKMICQEENINLSAPNFLLEICRKLDNDIRSCINCLQFLTARISPNAMMMNTSNDIIKGIDDKGYEIIPAADDIIRDMFSHPWFVKDKSGDLTTLLRAVFENVFDTNNTINTKFNRFETLSKMATNSNLDYEKIVTALFENYVNTKVANNDMFMHEIIEGLDWLSTYHDALSRYINQHQNYSLFPYLPITTVAFHTLFARGQPSTRKNNQSSYPNIYYNKRNYGFFQNKYHVVTSLIKEFIRGVNRHSKFHVDVRCVTTELANVLLLVLRPTTSLRQVSLQFYTSQEKLAILDICQTMIDYNLNFKQELRILPTNLNNNNNNNNNSHNIIPPVKSSRNDPQNSLVHRSYEFILTPNLKEICSFYNVNSVQNDREMPYGTKLIIQNQIKTCLLEKMATTTTTHNSKRHTELFHPRKTMVLKDQPVREEKDKPVPNTTTTHKRINSFDNFFIKKLKSSKQIKKVTGNELPGPTLVLPSLAKFFYNDGHTNAVRRSVKIKDFLQQLNSEL